VRRYNGNNGNNQPNEDMERHGAAPWSMATATATATATSHGQQFKETKKDAELPLFLEFDFMTLESASNLI
jgi:hypothetical protein